MKKRKYIIILIILIILLMISIAYAAYRINYLGNGYVVIAKPIFDIEVEDINSEENLNSYYYVTVKNYNSEGEVSEVAFDYEIEITTTDSSEVPEHYWYDETGNKIGEDLNGTLKNSEREEHVYKVCFINSGTEQISSNIKFKTIATQIK